MLVTMMMVTTMVILPMKPQPKMQVTTTVNPPMKPQPKILVTMNQTTPVQQRKARIAPSVALKTVHLHPLAELVVSLSPK
jgi:hypothetical protein